MGADLLDHTGSPAEHARVTAAAEGIRAGTGPGVRVGFSSRVRAYLVGGIGGASLVVAAVVQTVQGSWTGGSIVWLGLAVLPLYLVGVFLVRRRPDHPQARRQLLSASCMALGVAIETVVASTYLHDRPGPWFWLVNLVYAEVNLVGTVTGVTLIALYPEGVGERPWIRRTVRGLWGLCAVPPLLLLSHPTLVVDRWLPAPSGLLPNPWAVEWLAPVGGVLAEVSLGYAFASVVGPGLLLWRYRRAGAEQRALMRWLLYTLLTGMALLGLTQVARAAGLAEPWVWDAMIGIVSVATLLMLAVSIVVGVLRYRLFDIDVVFRRSAVFAVLWVAIGVLYVAVTATPGLALGGAIPVELAVLLTIAVAVAFQPVRRWLESWADRWVFGRRVDHYAVLRTLGATLEQSIDLTELVPRLAAAVREGLGARWVRVSLPGDDGTWPAERQVVDGSPDGEPGLTQELRRGEQVIGRIECGPTDGSYTAEDRQLLATLGGQAATAIANVGLAAQLSERLAELDRSRTRILSAQDAERRRIERDIHDGAQQQVVALITKLRLARNQVDRGESPGALLAEMQGDVRELLVELRELAHGIHPPVLSDSGLVAAVEARAGRLPVPVVVRAADGLQRQRFPQDVEGAAYFVVCEALTNVLKHAAASGTEIELAATREVLSIDVSDDGAGFGVPGRGTGLTNTRDRVEALGGRLRIDSRPGAGTRLHAELPLSRPAPAHV
jgi:signal transduction histidine kinase